PPNGLFQSTSPFDLSTHQSARLSPSATFKKMRLRQIIGVEPLKPGIATFQTTFSSVVHFTGRFFSLLIPLRAGPRHCGQFSASIGRENAQIQKASDVRYRNVSS